MAAPKGHPKWGGRLKGEPNKLSADIKDMIIGALQDVGGRQYLANAAIKQPAAFLTLVGKVLPLQIAGTDRDGNATAISFEWAKATPLIEGDAVAINEVPDKEAAD